MKNWSYTAGTLLVYVAVFYVWQAYPGRVTFMGTAGVAIALMTRGMVWAARRNYFANRRDLVLHALIVTDVGLEGGMYEIFRAISLWLVGDEGNVARFHDHHNFYVCAAAFGVLVGGYHWWALRRRTETIQASAI
jgi:hypothetical protein